MKEPIITLDSCDFVPEDHATYILRGWVYGLEQDELISQVRIGHLDKKCTLQWHARPDVKEARKDLKIIDDKVGFEIRIPDMKSSLDDLQESMRVRFVYRGSSYPLMKKSMEQVQEELTGSSLKYHIEQTDRRFDLLYIQGWCVNTHGKLEMSLQDEKGNPISAVNWGKIRRSDLAEIFHTNVENCQGFAIGIDRDTLTCEEVHLVMESEVAKKEYVIVLQQFDKENTRIHKLKKILRGNQQENKRILHEYGMKTFLTYLIEESGAGADSYAYYAKKQAPTKRELRRQAKEIFENPPLFSIVIPLYNTPERFLKLLLDSIINQSYKNWELCLADGSNNNKVWMYLQKNYGDEARIKYERLTENTGISGNTNAAIAMATGDYIVFADHDDELTPNALYEAAKVIAEHPETELIYSDEDIIDIEGNPMVPHFKPDFNLEMLRNLNYICHLVVVKKSLAEKTGGLKKEFDGAQDHEFLLHCTEFTSNVYHIPKVLYHWRSHEGSTAGNQDSKMYAVEAGKRALQEHYKRVGIDAEVEFSGNFIIYKTKIAVKGNPKVSILIPNKDHIEDLEKCIRSIEEKSTWKNYEIIVIENNSEEEKTFSYYEEVSKRYTNIKVVKYEGGFNYSAINNFGAKAADGEYLLLLNNDTEVITPDWLEQMLGYCQQEDVGIVGAKLYYPDQTIQHAGVVIGVGGFAGHIQTGQEKNSVGYMGRLQANQEISAVTAACLMVKKSVFDQIHGLDEEFAVALNDVDFCLRVRELGEKIVFLPHVELFHYESKSRGLEITPDKQKRFQKEIRRFQNRHREILEKGDPYYNPHLTLAKGDCSIRKATEDVKGNII